MSIENVKEYFKSYNMDSKIIELDESSATVELAAQAIGCMPELIAKTMAFIVNDKPILIVASGSVRIDNAKYKNKFKVKAKMLSADNVEELIGHKIGGVCPFGIKKGVDVYLDVSIKKLEKVFPACGSSNSMIELTIDEIEKYSNYIEWIDVCK